MRGFEGRGGSNNTALLWKKKNFLLAGRKVGIAVLCNTSERKQGDLEWAVKRSGNGGRAKRLSRGWMKKRGGGKYFRRAKTRNGATAKTGVLCPFRKKKKGSSLA